MIEITEDLEAGVFQQLGIPLADMLAPIDVATPAGTSMR